MEMEGCRAQESGVPRTAAYVVAQDWSFWDVLVDLMLKREQQQLNLSWEAKLTLLMLGFLHSIARSLKHIGKSFELFQNTINSNGGFLKSAFRFLANRTDLVVPERDSDKFISIIGLTDWRTELYQDVLEREGKKLKAEEKFPLCSPNSKFTADVCAMASKLAYENWSVVQKVVTEVWKMHFVNLYNCWNERQQKHSTQVFIMTDRAEDARAIVVAFRGTETFNAIDWSTDMDFSWYKLPNMGRVHLGFLEALGMGDRNDMETFTRMKRKIMAQLIADLASPMAPKTPSSGLPDPIILNEDKPLGYDVVSDKILDLMKLHPNAKLYITGHSLGAALAVLFSSLLFYNQEHEITSKLAALYTFGQPRVGDGEFALYMEIHLTHCHNRYYRFTYCNDAVPRVPFDDSMFGFKHFGTCFYFNSRFQLKVRPLEPNPNFSPSHFLRLRITAAWELLQSLFMGLIHGNEFRENSCSFGTRLLGFLIPGFASHSFVNYVNSVRLGPSLLLVNNSSQNKHD